MASDVLVAGVVSAAKPPGVNVTVTTALSMSRGLAIWACVMEQQSSEEFWNADQCG
jgi:hypothetical protein